MIDIQGVSKRFGSTTALREVSLSVQPGEVFCLLGANGAGKTTLLNVCLGFLRPDSGAVRINGVDAICDPQASRGLVGYVPEQVLLYEALTGLEHIQFFSSLSGAAMSDEAALAALSSTGLDSEAARRRVGVYSKGMRQKVALAIALAKRASTLLLDEPLSGLDPKSAIDLSERLRTFSRDGRAVLLTTHDLFRALETATHIGIMRGGEMRSVMATEGLRYEELEQRYLEIISDLENGAR